jgi:CubicO group peptidase (beta-lactamase class C family)
MATTGYKSPYYGHSFWIYPAPYDYIFGFRGMLGQDIIIDPRHNRTVVRVGQHRGKKTIGDFNEMEAALLRQTDLWDAQ